MLVAGRYRLERELARGGMGTVWLAEDQKLGRLVAIKVMAQELAQMSEALQRFEREAMAVAGLRSTHVVEVYDYGVQEGLPYIVMELLEGENLGQRLKRTTRISPAETNRIIVQVCKGLKAAHAAQLIHRDLKPSNIFIARRDDVEVVKLLDFGVVKELSGEGSGEATVTGILLGTPQYMSPEQARATRDIDHRSDLWSVAVIAFRMLTGTNPFRGDSVGDVVLKICSDALPRITDHRSDLPPTVNAFFDRAFKRDANERFQSAAEMAFAFDDIIRRAEAVTTPEPRPPVLSEVGGVNELGPMTAPLGATTPMPRPAFTSSAPSIPATATGLPPSPSPSLTPAPRGSMPSISLAHVAYESTPVSTTVGGTQLAPKVSVAPPTVTGSTVALIVGGAAGLIAVALVVAVWMGSDGGPTAVPAANGSASPLFDYASNDDDGPDDQLPDESPQEGASTQADEPPSEPSAATAEPAKESEPTTKSSASARAQTFPVVPAPRTRPGPQPPAKPGGSRPDWGLGEDG